jgi:hypothetical protein
MGRQTRKTPGSATRISSRAGTAAASSRVTWASSRTKTTIAAALGLCTFELHLRCHFAVPRSDAARLLASSLRPVAQIPWGRVKRQNAAGQHIFES